MIREHLIHKSLAHEPTFRWRGGEVTRLEALTDAVFGFAITLLVVSLEVPKTYSQLMLAMRGFVPFALCFAALLQIWFAHYRFFRRYGLEDATTHAINAVLLFLILFFVYPLKFLFTAMCAPLLGLSGPATPGAEQAYAINGPQASHLIVVYGLGGAAVFSCFALLYLHAYRKREALGLNEIERLSTVVSLIECTIPVAVAFLSIGVDHWFGPQLAGLTYLLLAPLLTWVKSWEGKHQAQFQAEQVSASPP